jgi:hypothetical protein
MIGSPVDTRATLFDTTMTVMIAPHPVTPTTLLRRECSASTAQICNWQAIPREPGVRDGTGNRDNISGDNRRAAMTDCSEAVRCELSSQLHLISLSIEELKSHRNRLRIAKIFAQARRASSP